MADDSNAIAKLIHSLIDQVNELRKVQDQALTDSIYIGATTEEREQYDKRRERINELQKRLEELLRLKRSARGASNGCR